MLLNDEMFFYSIHWAFYVARIINYYYSNFFNYNKK